MNFAPLLAALAVAVIDCLCALVLPPTWVGPFAWFPIGASTGIAGKPPEGAILSEELRASVATQSVGPIRRREPFQVDVRLRKFKIDMVVRFRARWADGRMAVSARAWPQMVIAPWFFMCAGWLLGSASSQRPVDGAKTALTAGVAAAVVSTFFALNALRFRKDVQAIARQLFETLQDAPDVVAAQAASYRPKRPPPLPRGS